MQFVSRIAEDLAKPIIDKQPMTIDAGLCDAHSCLIEGDTEMLCTLAQPLFGIVSLSNIRDHANPPVDCLIPGLRRHVHYVNPPRATFGVLNLGLVFHSLTGEYPLDIRPDRLIDLPTNYIEHRAASDLLWFPPQPRRITATDPHITQVTAAACHSGRHVICYELQLL